MLQEQGGTLAYKGEYVQLLWHIKELQFPIRQNVRVIYASK